MILPIALTTAGAAAIMNGWLAIRASRTRLSERVSIGDGGSALMLARMRAHANFAEYTPIVLILVALIEFAVGTSQWLWGVAILYLLARLAHPFGMDGVRALRMFGAVVTLLVTLGLGAYAVALPFLASARISPAVSGSTETVPPG